MTVVSSFMSLYVAW